MKKIFAVLAFLSAMVLMISCGNSSSSDNDSVTNFGKLGQECYPNETCDKGLICDTDNNICVEDPGNPINDSDKTDSGSDEESDTESDSDSDSGDTIPDGADTTPEQPDNDTDTDSGDTTPDNDHPQTPDTLTLGNICTGQNKCYNNEEEITCPSSSSDDFYGQDAQYTSKCTAQSFSASLEVVVDNNTGLTWQRNVPETYTECASETECTFSEAQTYCNNLSLNGLSNWRVPNPLELLTIINNSTCEPATNSNFTNNMAIEWTSKQYDSSNAYIFNPGYGSEGYTGKKNTYKVRCVSGDELLPATSSDFETSSDGLTVTDTKAGLMWQKDYVPDKTWQQALAYCQILNTDGYGGYSTEWRLPNKNELASLLNHDKSSAPHSDFPDMPSKRFWSSSTSTYVYAISLAWFVDFDGGEVFYDGKTATSYVRCVRSDQ